MAFIFAENENRDLFLGADNRITTITGLQATSQTAKGAVELQLGEAIYNTDAGVPTVEVVWSGSTNLPQFEFYARKEIVSKPGVEEVLRFDAEIDGDQLKYEAEILADGSQSGILGSILRGVS